MSAKEKQYNACFDLIKEQGYVSLGAMSSHTWICDPKRLLFVLSRYKFVAKMFDGFTRVLEVGCADAFASRVVAQAVDQLTVTDFDPLFVEDAKKRKCGSYDFECRMHDMLKGPIKENFEGAYALDVLEHIPRESEAVFLKHIAQSLSSTGSLIIGMPSLNSQRFASKLSKEGHVNCKSFADLRETCRQHFANVFVFSLNDEVVHTGFHEMANYFLALCCMPHS